MRATHPDAEESLWALIASPVIWVVHFVLTYATAAIWCARVSIDASLGSAGTAIAVYTLLALGGITLVGLRAYRRVARVAREVAHDDDSPVARHRFLAFSTLLLSGLSAVAVLYEAMAVVLVSTCR